MKNNTGYFTIAAALVTVGLYSTIGWLGIGLIVLFGCVAGIIQHKCQSRWVTTTFQVIIIWVITILCAPNLCMVTMFFSTLLIGITFYLNRKERNQLK